jgi:hypothetical protein
MVSSRWFRAKRRAIFASSFALVSQTLFLSFFSLSPFFSFSKKREKGSTTTTTTTTTTDYHHQIISHQKIG